MKNYNLIERLWKTDSHEKQTPQRFARYAVMLLMLLTLGVGQMWADMGFENSNNGILFSRTPLGGSKADYRVEHGRTNSTQDAGNVSALTMKEWYAKLYQNEDNIWGDGHMYYRIYLKDSSAPGFTTSNKSYYNWNSWNSGWRYPTFGNNSLSVNVLSGLASGIYYFEYYFDATATSTLYCSNNSSNFKVKFTIKPNALTSFSVSRSGYSAGSGTNDDPYIIACGGSLTLTASGSGGTSDANSSIKYKYGSDDWTTSSKTISNITSTTKQSITVKGARRHNSQDLGSDESSVTIYYKAETTYSVSISSGSPSSVQAGANYTTPTITASNVTGYHFDHWSISGNANVASTTTSPTTVTATSTGATITANYEPNTYTITLDDNGSYQGDGSATATYDNGTLTDFSHASRTGWSPSGYYTGASDGTMVIDAGGNLVASVAGYTDASGNWTRAADTKLYARWVQAYAVLYNANGGTGTTTDASSPYAPGADVTVLGNSFTRTGYTFTGWNTAYDGSGNPYAAGAKIEDIDANVTLYAQWTENLTTVTVGVNPSNSGTLTLDASAFTPGNTTTAGVTTSHTVVTTAQPGYKFSSWGTTGNATGTSSTNTYTLKGNGSGSTGSLTANFSRLYAYVQGRFQVKDAARSTTTTTYGSGGQWSDESTNIQMDYDNTNHRFILHTHMTPSELTANHGTGCLDCKPYFFIKTSTSNSSLAGVTSYKCTASGATLVSTGSANGATVSSSGSNTLRFNSSTTSGYAVVYFDQSKIWYELEYRLQYNANGGSGTAPTGANGNNSYHATSTTAATNTFTARAYYTFGGWNTAQYITGTNYAAGASVPMTANTTLYAKWTRSVTLNQEDATTTGSTSVTGTYNCATLPAITNPKKTGYEFGGWYTETAGNGNLVINTSGQLQTSKFHWTDASGRFDRTTEKAAADLYAKWTQTVTLNANTGNHGSGSNTTATIVYKATAKSSITHCTPATGYHLEGYYTAATDGVKVLNADGSFASSAVTDYITDGKWTKAGATMLYAHYEPNTYDVILDVNGATTGSNQTVVATFDAAMPTTQKTSGDAITAPSKTGYTFGGYYANTNGTGTQYYTNALASNHMWDVDNDGQHIYAKWTANPYTITLTQSGETGYGSAGTASVTATYDAALPTISSLPTAANGYAFMGYFTGHNGEGTQYYDATGTKLVATYTTADALELFAYFKKAEITDVELNETMFDPVAAGDEGYVVANPTIAPNPTGDHIICWELLYDNDNPVTGHDAIADPDGSHLNRIKFSIAGLAAGGYKIRTTLRTGSSCAGGTLLDTRVTTFQIANAFTVTVEYKDSEGNTIAASTTSPGKALESTDITAPDLIGYTFSTWQLGEGMSTEEALTTETDFSYKTTFNSTLTAVYTKKRMIYFNNTLGWKSVYVYFYKNDSYWENGDKKRGSGSKTTSIWTDTPYELGKHGQMQPVSEGSNIYYFDAEAEGVPSSYDDVVFTEDSQHDYEFFYRTNAVRRGDYKSSLPMFVPVPKTEQTADVHNETNYYNHGCWMNYPNNTGYVLHIYNSKTYGASDELMSIPFEYTADKTMPMSLTVELAGGKEYGFEIHRADGKKYGTDTKVMKNGDSGDDGTGWALAENKRTGLLTSVAGDYTFTLNYGNSGGYNFLAGVHYPVAANDYRVVYNDRVAWSQGTAHSASWYHPSRAIEKKDGAEDIVSFYVSKEDGASASMKFQYASSVSGEGVVTWSDVDGGSISLSDITESGVYNFYLSQAAGSITVDSIRPYTGQYYIRSQAVTGGWDNYRVGSDHKMTYSEFSESAANTFGEKFSHYKAKWCPRNTNIAFTIANDYSMCITDTLKQDVGNPYNNTDADGKLNNDGNDGHSGSNAYLDPNSANVRFMWNRKTNKISRAYVASSTSTEARFLVLQGSGTANANIFDENGSALSANSPGTNATLLRDDQNWIYEITVQANPSALVKLYANYKGQKQYFRGTSDAGFVKGTSAVELLGGTSSPSKYSVRVVYDFKTNRLVTAWQPTGSTEEINGVLNINADVMVIRSHHEPAQCITFANDESALNGVKTVYGVMQFNRWILNNREHPEDDTPEHCEDAVAIATYHRPLAIGDQKSIYERSHYYISFPFDVRLSDVFGFGQYWNEWYIEWYDGLTRAKNGYWIDSPSNWKYVTPEEKDTFVLKANQGYILGLDMDYMQATDFTFWSNKNTTIELYFPSTVSLETLKSTQVTIPALNTIEGDPYRCTINRENGDDGDRRIKDSYWRCIGVPSFNMYNSALEDREGNTIEWKDNYEWKEDDAAFPFIYLWNKADNTITPQATSEFSFQPMHAYLVQNGGVIVWTAVSAKPSSIVARQRNTEPEEYNWRLELQQNNQMIDRTYIRMKDLESVTDGFDFGQDMSKEFNKKRSAIFSFIGTEKVAANSMTVHTDQTTIVPLGLDIKSAGEYVISLPEGTNGVGVVLVDSITGTRTNLGLMDYEVSLTAGKIDNRFFLEISPIVQTPTDIEAVSDQHSAVRKVMIDGILYIVKDGQVFDARGSRVK